MIVHPPSNILVPGDGVALSIATDGVLEANIAATGGLRTIVDSTGGTGLYYSGKGPACVLRQSTPFAVSPNVDNVIQWPTVTRRDPPFTLTSATSIIGFINPFPWPVVLLYTLTVRFAAAGGGLDIYRLCEAIWDDLGTFTVGDYAPSTGSQFDPAAEDHVCLAGTRTVGVGGNVDATFFAYHDEAVSINCVGADASVVVLEEFV